MVDTINSVPSSSLRASSWVLRTPIQMNRRRCCRRLCTEDSRRSEFVPLSSPHLFVYSFLLSFDHHHFLNFSSLVYRNGIAVVSRFIDVVNGFVFQTKLHALMHQLLANASSRSRTLDFIEAVIVQNKKRAQMRVRALCHPFSVYICIFVFCCTFIAHMV